MAYVNVAEWNPEHVADWLRGLEDEIQPYTQFFINNKVNGCQLLTLARDDLTNLNMTKIGHQEFVLEAVELLRQLHYNLTSETLQSLALKLGLSDIINLVKSLISWLDRYPFVGQESYSEGIHINSPYGIHIIEDIKFQSPAYRSGKVEEGDEIIQVNYQTVVGWQIKSIICTMKEHPTEVHLTLKKRPRHPNVLGQVITLSPGTRGESNSVSEVNGGLASEKEKLFAVNKPRNRLRRRATVTGVSPTALQAPVSLEELIGNSSKRKELVLRTISYDPNKTIDLEDVFKRDPQSTQENKEGTSKPEEKANGNSTTENDEKPTKSPFLRPPQEKFNTGHLKRQEALKNSETVARAAVAVPQPANAPSKPPLRITAPPQNSSNDASSVAQETPPPSGSQSPKQKLAEWVNRQKKKPEVGLLQHALTLFSSDSSSQPSTSAPKESGSPKSPKCSISGSPKVKKASGTIFQFPFREGRPSLSELRSLKRTANSKVFSERVNSNSQSDKPLASPKQNALNKRPPMQSKNQGIKNLENCLNTSQNNPIRNPKMQPVFNGETCGSHSSSKITDSYIHPKNINYAKIPQYPCEMHESKIVSLKAKAGSNNNSQCNKQNIPVVPQISRNNQIHYQRARQMSKLTTPGMSTLLRNQKPGYPAAFCSPSGRSLSFNNIAISSEDDSSSEEYEIYEELSTVSAPDFRQQDPTPNGPPLFKEWTLILLAN
ncbi:hypothetical protein CEXT_811761 [Caerostris extrusa]|uniref:Connector enhancer of kinase suppressor of ras 2 n=1 Tax=Caerostris extrusa TaxID=172846 RepID=A0AAV4NLV7_CAEEX|nr:hypothetical protein CEXT_811761 [Caerostris extrusa]